MAYAAHKLQATPSLAQAPPFQANLRVRYEFTVAGYDAFGQLVGTHRAHSLSTTDRLRTELVTNVSVAYDQPEFSTLDGSIGISKDAWNLQLYGTNLTDKRGVVFSTYTQWIKTDTVNRPRTFMLRFGYRFSGQ